MSQDDVTRQLAKSSSQLEPLERVPESSKPEASQNAATVPITAPKPHNLPFGGTIDRYLVLSVLGHGGMGVVYAAYDPALDRKIAVKLLHNLVDDDGTEGRARMHREAQALARLSHPNVITVHDVSEYRGAMYIAMELVTGGTLGDWQRDKPWRAIVDAYVNAARGLAAAHAAELIHRDFKPENVLVGEDGRVRVTDFGLARLATSAPDAKPVHASPTSQLANSLTAEGAVMGTPSYMAPEQIDGEPVDARTDQFSWCIALWEALYGEQPFPRGNLSLRSAAMRTDTPKPPASSKVPRAIARILARGLAGEPGKRWPSLDAIIDAIRRVTSAKRAVFAGVAVVGIAALAIVFVVGRRAGAPSQTCDEAGAAIDAIWTAGAKRELATSFAATNAPFATDASASVVRAIDTWRDRWSTLATESCAATRAGTQSDAMLDLRSGCLARRKDELRTVLAALAQADRRLVETARTLALPDLDACNDAAVLAGASPAPSDPAKQQALRALDTELATLESQLLHGLSLDRARALDEPTQTLVKRAIAIEWAPIAARARHALAGVQRELGNGKPARATLMAAAASASAANDLDRLVTIYSDLISVEARLTSEYVLGDGWATLAEGTLARLGPRADKQLRVHRERALVAQKAGRLEDARTANQAALAIARTRGPNVELEVLADLGLVEADLGELDSATTNLERAYALARAEVGAQHPKLASIEHDLGTMAYRRGKYADSERRFRAALAVREKSLEPDDLALAGTIEALGVALIQQARLDEAQPHLERALHIMEQRLGGEHPDVANALNDIGGAYHQAGEFERELAVGTRALAIREKALGPDHPDVAQSLVNVAIASKALERWDVVIPNYRRAITIFEKAFGTQHVNTAITRLNFAETLRVQGRLDAAAVEYEAARIVFVKQFGVDHPLLGHIWNGIGQLEFARGRAEAVPLLERAVALREKDPGDPTALAESRFALAKALGKAQPRAVTLATQARDAYRTAGKSFTKQVSAVEAWLR